MSKIFKILSDFFDLLENPRMMPPCPVPLYHSGCSDVRCVGAHNELLAI